MYNEHLQWRSIRAVHRMETLRTHRQQTPLQTGQSRHLSWTEGQPGDREPCSIPNATAAIKRRAFVSGAAADQFLPTKARQDVTGGKSVAEAAPTAVEPLRPPQNQAADPLLALVGTMVVNTGAEASTAAFNGASTTLSL